MPSDLRARCRPAMPRSSDYVNQLNQALNDRLQKGGEVFVSNAVIGGRYVLRACIVNFRTEQADVDALPGIVVRVGRGIDRELRPTPLK